MLEQAIKDELTELIGDTPHHKVDHLYQKVIDKVDKAIFEHVQELAHGSLSKATRMLTVNRRTVSVKMDRLGVRRMRGYTKYPFTAMEVGEEVYFPNTIVSGGTEYKSATNYGCKCTPKKKFSGRQHGGGIYIKRME